MSYNKFLCDLNSSFNDSLERAKSFEEEIDYVHRENTRLIETNKTLETHLVTSKGHLEVISKENVLLKSRIMEVTKELEKKEREWKKDMDIMSQNEKLKKINMTLLEENLRNESKSIKNHVNSKAKGWASQMNYMADRMVEEIDGLVGDEEVDEIFLSDEVKDMPSLVPNDGHRLDGKKRKRDE
jgi:hypothetical protein